MREGLEGMKQQPRVGTVGLCSALLAFGLMVLAEPARAAGDLVLIPSPMILISLLVLFVILIFPLNALIFKPIFNTLDERDRQTVGAREESAEVARKADEVLQRYRSELRAARLAAEKARRESVEVARKEQARLTGEARMQAEQKVEQGRSELSASLEQARSELEGHARDLAGAAAQRILGRVL